MLVRLSCRKRERLRSSRELRKARRHGQLDRFRRLNRFACAIEKQFNGAAQFDEAVRHENDTGISDVYSHSVDFWPVVQIVEWLLMYI